MIIYQIAEVIPELRPYVTRIIEAEPSILDRSIEEQTHRLLLEPLRQLSTDYPGLSVRLVAKLNFSHDRLLGFALMVERHLDNVTATRGRLRRVLSQRARQSSERGSESAKSLLMYWMNVAN